MKSLSFITEGCESTSFNVFEQPLDPPLDIFVHEGTTIVRLLINFIGKNCDAERAHLNDTSESCDYLKEMTEMKSDCISL